MNDVFSLEQTLPVLREVTESGGEFRLYPKGTSMLPTLKQGRDSVGLRKTREIKKGDVLLYRRATGEYVLHRVLAVEKDGTLTMCGDNQTVLERGLPISAVIATAERLFIGDKAVKRDSVKYRLLFLKARIRTRTLWILRRAYRFVKKILCIR